MEPQLAVDRAQVPVDGAGAEEELLGDLGVGQPGGDQAQHFGLPGAESSGVCLWGGLLGGCLLLQRVLEDRKSTRLNSSHANISYAVFCLKKKNKSTYLFNPFHHF